MEFKNILKTIWTYRKFLIKYTIIISVLIFVLLFLFFPISYQSTVTVLPPEKNTNMGGISALLGNNGSPDISNLISGGLSNANSQLFVEIIKSRTAAEYVIRKNNLISFFNAEDMEEAVNKLQKKIEIEVSKEGIIKLSAELSTNVFPLLGDEKTKVRKLSADVANTYIEALDYLNRKKLSSKARNAREYIEDQIVKTRYTLDSVEISLSNFQKTNKTISLPEQVKNSIETAAKIKSEIVKTEIELGLAEKNMRDNNQALLSLREKLHQLNEQYSKIEVGSPDYQMSFKEVPELGKTLSSLLREVKIQNEVYLMLQQQYYKEKIQENKDIPTIEILDIAIPPKKPSGPRMFLASGLGGFSAFALLSLLLVYSENKNLGLFKKYV